jgi:hypothetical protein
MKTVIVLAIAIAVGPLATIAAFIIGARIHRMGMRDAASIINKEKE